VEAEEGDGEDNPAVLVNVARLHAKEPLRWGWGRWGRHWRRWRLHPWNTGGHTYGLRWRTEAASIPCDSSCPL
jgi:hypothetical protein